MKLISLKYCIALAFFISGIIAGQSNRSLNNDGVDLYSNQKYADAEVKFKKLLEKDPKLFEGHFNLGDSYYKQGRYDEALSSFNKSLEYTDDKSNRSKVYHNMGNSFMKGEKYKEAIQSYASALKNNPDDLETKYNLSYALNMMKQNQQQNQQNKNDKDKDKKDQNKDQKQNQDQQQNKNEDKKDDKKEQQQEQQQQQKNQISKEEAERILEALKNNEKDLQKKIRKIQGKAKTTEKDW
ncbi:MAG: tetratricopeptide repeat protein [Ignavibacteria bacterium]|jgi:tetratricopeptide (TPR) repeat protein|nr:tetratricopeptide repeat protein [Ignavibacteria bacterium]